MYMGVELEVDDGGKDSGNARKILSVFNRNAEYGYIKSDGSLDDGLELVTHPCTLKAHLQEVPWEETIGDLYHYQHHQMEVIDENRVNSVVSQLVTLANRFICAIQHFFFVNFYIVGGSDQLPPDAFLKVLDSLLDVHQIRDNS